MAYAEKTKSEWNEYWKQYWIQARELSENRWESILSALGGSNLGPAIQKNAKGHVPCPVHGGTDGFRLRKDWHKCGRAICNTCGSFSDGFALLAWVNKWSLSDTARQVMRHLTGDSKIPSLQARLNVVTTIPKKVGNELDDVTKKSSLNRVWTSSVPLDHRWAEPARLYFARRGITDFLNIPSVRFHPELAYFDGEKISGYMPGLVCMFESVDEQPITLQRHFLDMHGNKAAVESPKKMMGIPSNKNPHGGAVRLKPAGRILGVAEGLETALAAAEGSGLPVWATVNAIFMESFVPPPGVEQLVVFSDKDRPSIHHPQGHGQEAARALVARAWEMGIQAFAVTPSGEIPEGEKSIDWLDVLRTKGTRGFPSFNSIRLSALKQAA